MLQCERCRVDKFKMRLDEMEVYVLVEKKKNILVKLCAIVSFVLGGLSLLLMVLGGGAFILMAAAFILLGWFLNTRNYEYEYSYFDGEFRFAKILNKSNRKTLKGYVEDEVIVIAPLEDRAVYQYLNNPKAQEKDYTSGNADAKIYVMVAKSEAGINVIKFEPDDKYLDAVCIKYRQKVVR